MLDLSDPTEWRLACTLLRRTAAARIGAGGESKGDEVRAPTYNGKNLTLSDWRMG